MTLKAELVGKDTSWGVDDEGNSYSANRMVTTNPEYETWEIYTDGGDTLLKDSELEGKIKEACREQEQE